MFVRNIPPVITEYMLFDLFLGLSNGKVERVKKINNFAFVHFFDRSSAERVLAAKNMHQLAVK